MKLPFAQGCSARSQWTTLLLFATGGCALVAALLVGVADNLPGLVLCYVAVTAFLLALVHTWRSAKRYLILLVASLLGFPLAVILHNLFYALSEVAAEFVGLVQVLGLLEVGFFLVAVLVCPPGALIGAVGAVVTAILGARQKQDPGPDELSL